jgi:Zn-dependent peptidase ImmA (M78 family)
VSREVIVRRMLSLNLIDIRFYQEKRDQYNQEYEKRRTRRKGYPSPIIDALSIMGKSFIGLALENLNRGMITTSDFSEFVGLKIKHLDRLSEHFILR